MRAIAAAIAIIASTASSATAADIEIHDLRAELGVTPGPRSIDEDYTAGTGSTRPTGSASYKSNASPCIDLYVGFAGGTLHDHGFVYGFGLDAARGQINPRFTGSGALSYATLLPELRVGYGYAFNTSFHIEVTPFLGYGLAATEWSDNGSKTTGYGTALVYGVLVGGYARMGEGWSLGGNAGFQGGMANVSVTNDQTHGQSDLTLQSGGLVAHIGVGYQF